MNAELGELYRQHYGQILATITRMVGDISTAEDVVQDSFVKASNWPAESPPQNPAAWLTQTAKNLAIDHIRRNKNWQQKADELSTIRQAYESAQPPLNFDDPAVLQDDMLRLLFTCCHPALNQQAQVALCLNTVCGLTTDEIAKAFITPSATMSQRLWRAKTKIKNAGISYQVPEASELPARLDAVASVIYLIFNEGWLASHGSISQRQDLVKMAITTAQTLTSSLPDSYDIQALWALMVLQNSRRDARFGPQGKLITLPEQDRSKWYKDEISQAFARLHFLFKSGHGNNRYALMAAIAAEHSRALSPDQTNWREICTLYEALMALDGSEVIRLNHAVAIGERDGAAAGLSQVEALSQSQTMQRYYLFHSTRAEFLRRLSRKAEAKMAYNAAKSLTSNLVEQEFLQERIQTLGK